MARRPADALARLCAAIAQRCNARIRLEDASGAKERRIVVYRGKRKVATFVPHSARINLELIVGLAHAGRAVGGAGMTWAEIEEIVDPSRKGRV